MAGGKSDKPEAVLLRACYEKAEFFGKDNNAGKTQGSRKRERPNTRWTDFIKEAMGMSSQERGGAVEDWTVWMSLIHMAARSYS